RRAVVVRTRHYFARLVQPTGDRSRRRLSAGDGRIGPRRRHRPQRRGACRRLRVRDQLSFWFDRTTVRFGSGRGCPARLPVAGPAIDRCRCGRALVVRSLSRLRGRPDRFLERRAGSGPGRGLGLSPG
ncbi:hypothetical protein LTR94_032286, partial [Friedmanniomyces endolithicus]